MSALGEEIRASLVWFCAFWRPAGRGTLLDMIEDLANEIGIGDVFDDAELPAAERAEGCAPR